jgi:hypothetical protein
MVRRLIGTAAMLPAFVNVSGPADRQVPVKAGISEATYFNRKKKYEGLLPDEMRRLKQLEDENAKLKKLVADLSLDKAMLQDVLRRKT